MTEGVTHPNQLMPIKLQIALQMTRLLRDWPRQPVHPRQSQPQMRKDCRSTSVSVVIIGRSARVPIGVVGPGYR